MWLELFLCLLLAHLVADFVLQTGRTCKDKADRKWRCPFHYAHALIVFALSWLVSCECSFWWCALIVGMSHLCIDIWKSYHDGQVYWFVIDQALHILVIAGVSVLWCLSHQWAIPFGISPLAISASVAVLVCWKPANIFIKMMLKHYSVNMPEGSDSGFNAGALIGTVERWLILIFVCLHCYEALGLLIAAKSIIRFGDSETKRSEYVLAGTLLSIFIAVLAGLMVELSRSII